MRRFSTFAEYFTAACAAALACFAVGSGLFYADAAECRWFALAIAAAAAAIFALRFVKDEFHYAAAMCLLAAACLAMRFVIVTHYHVEPDNDYQTFYLAASQLAADFRITDAELARYIALFPHIFGYAFFLSLVFRSFGASAMTAAVTNVLLSGAALYLIWYIASRLVSKRAGLFAALLWTICPSQILYNVYVLSEPYYTALLLAAAALLVRMEREPRPGAKACFAALCGAALALAEAARPIASILLIAAALWTLFFARRESRGEYWRGVGLIALAAAVFFAGKAANSALVGAGIGMKPASSSLGYTEYVGFNTETGGTWNEDDAGRLDEYTRQEPFSADAVMERMSADARGRIASESAADKEELMRYKLVFLLFCDSGAVDYSGEAIPDSLADLSNAFWLALWLLAAAGCALMAVRKNGSLLWAPVMFVIGLTAAHMLTEVAARYHYAMLPALMLAASFAAEQFAALGKKAPA